MAYHGLACLGTGVKVCGDGWVGGGCGGYTCLKPNFVFCFKEISSFSLAWHELNKRSGL
jgi:hypothetical protein